jgi:CHAT domain-containing protein
MMKNAILFLLFITVFGISNVWSQKSLDDYYNDNLEGYKANDLEKMKSSSESLIKYYSDKFGSFYLYAYYQILKGDLVKAQAATTQTLNLEPLMQYGYYTQSYIDFLNGQTESAFKNLEWAMQLCTFTDPKDIIDDMEKIELFTKKDLSPLKNQWLSYYQNKRIDSEKATTFEKCTNWIFIGGLKCENLDSQFANFSSMKNANLLLQKLLPLYKAVTFYYEGNTIESTKQFEIFIEISKNNPLLYAKRSYALYFLSIIKNNSYNSKGALVTINEAIAETAKLPFITVNLANMQLQKILVLKMLGDQNQQKLQTAYQLEQTTKTLDNPYFMAKAYNSIGVYYFMEGPQSEMSKGSEYLVKAYNLAKTINDKDLTCEVSENYAMVKVKQGQFAEASRINDEVAQIYLADKKTIDAQNLYNNMAFIYYLRKDYQNGITQFEKSIALAETIKKGLNAKQKLEYMNDVSGAYTGLIMCYKETNQTEKLFNLQEKTRSGYLKDLLDNNSTVANVKDAQNLLQNDELLLTYTIGKPGEIIITAISKNKAEIRYNYPIDNLIAIKKIYTDRIKKVPSNLNPYLQDFNVDYENGKLVRYANKESNYKKEDFVTLVRWTRDVLEESNKPEMQKPLTDFLHFWYNLTLAPVQDLISQYNNVIISAASELNYLPFETFISPKNQYFISTNNVRYIPNVTIWKMISNRNYSATRKSVIAFGGAQYQPSGNVKGTVRNMEDFYKISDAVSKKIDQGIYNFKPELEAVGFGGANYLAGTLREVQYIGTLSNDAKVVTGLNMTESYFKKANLSGELKQYKNLIISTHGFTDDVIPEFSGVMFSQPNSGDGNEDTFLLAPEIEKLNLNADLTILSACSTAVGELYGGEGISGLNTSFLVAGSNSTLLSLWPVDDASTALTMQLLFKNIIQNNGKPNVVLNDIKRAFINGEFGERVKSPQFWAPFLYNGR